MSYELFWTLNPRKLKAFEKAYKLRIKDQNQLFFIQGQYTLAALAATVGNMFKKRGQKAIEYPKEPFDIFGEKHIRVYENMTEEEKDIEVEKFFNSLIAMQDKFENSKGGMT